MKHKKKLLLIVIVLTLSHHLARAQFSVGVKAGANVAFMRSNHDEGANRLGYHLGAYINKHFNTLISIQPELLFNSAGFQHTGYAGVDDAVYTRLNYIAVPVNVKLKLGFIDLHAGPQLGFLVAAKTISDGRLPDKDRMDDYKNLDIGLNIGAGADFGKLNATLRYTMGLSNVAESGTEKSGVVQLSLGYRVFKRT